MRCLTTFPYRDSTRLTTRLNATNMNEEKFLYEKESRLIYDACHEVWKQYAGAFKEAVIDRALSVVLREKGLAVEDQKRINLYYKDQKVGAYVIDKVINDKILIELKRKNFIIEEDIRQFWYYLKASHYKLGFLINFGPRKIEIIRRVYDTARDSGVASSSVASSVK